MPRCIEQNVERVTDAFPHAREGFPDVMAEFGETTPQQRPHPAQSEQEEEPAVSSHNVVDKECHRTAGRTGSSIGSLQPSPSRRREH
jgi:hypothetical protein